VLKTTSHFTPEQLIYTQKLAEPVTVLNNLESTFTFKPSQGVGLQGKTEVTVTYLLDVTAPGGVLYGKKELRARLDGEARNYLAAVEKSMREFIAEQVKN